MDRVFLDANVLFSAAYQVHSAFRTLWTLRDVQLLTSAYSAEEARRNLQQTRQREELSTLLQGLHVADGIFHQTLVTQALDLPSKDLPILLGAIATHSTHLLTGDVTHFGKYFGQTIEGVCILLPGQYLRIQTS